MKKLQITLFRASCIVFVQYRFSLKKNSPLQNGIPSLAKNPRQLDYLDSEWLLHSNVHELHKTITHSKLQTAKGLTKNVEPKGLMLNVIVKGSKRCLASMTKDFLKDNVQHHRDVMHPFASKFI